MTGRTRVATEACARPGWGCGASLSGAAIWSTLARIGSRSSGVATIRSNSANGPPVGRAGPAACGRRIAARIQRATDALRRPLVIRTSGQGGAEGREPAGSRPPAVAPSSRARSAGQRPEGQPLLLEWPAKRRGNATYLPVLHLALARQRPDQRAAQAAARARTWVPSTANRAGRQSSDGVELPAHLGIVRGDRLDPAPPPFLAADARRRP